VAQSPSAKHCTHWPLLAWQTPLAQYVPPSGNRQSMAQVDVQFSQTGALAGQSAAPPQEPQT
jgi:hypothetical protein